MAQAPDEKTYLEIPFIEQLKGMDWDNGEVQQEDGVCWMVKHGRIWLIGSFLQIRSVEIV